MNKDQSTRWKKLQGNKKGGAMRGFYTVVLWAILVISIINGITIYSTANSFLIAVIAFCALAIRAKMSDEAESIIAATRSLEETITKEAKAFNSNGKDKE